MKTLLLSTVIGLFFQLFAQVTQESPKTYAPEKNALIFSIGSNFTLASFEDASVAYQRQLDAHSAVRVKLNFSGNDSKINNDNTDDYDTVHRVTNEEIETNGFSLGINPVYLRYHAAKNNIYFFYGAGPQLGFGVSKYVKNIDHSVDLYSDDNTETTQSTYFFGANALCGVEWFPTESISLHAEYAVSLQYMKSESESKTVTVYNSRSIIQKNRISNDSVIFSAKNVSLGLSIYF